METGLFVDKGPELMVPSMKRGDFMDEYEFQMIRKAKR